MNKPHQQPQEQQRLPQRKVRFDFTDTPLHWVPNEPEASHIMNTLHILLPAGEFWFCRVYNQALKQVTDPALREEVRGFIRQEAQHARAHDSALTPYLLRHGITAQCLWKTAKPGELISKTATEGKFDLVVMGSHGHGAFLNLVMGSVATEVLACCKVPVLFVR